MSLTTVCSVASGFNTDDGIRRAAMPTLLLSRRALACFNTDDGIRRAAIFRPMG